MRRNRVVTVGVELEGAWKRTRRPPRVRSVACWRSVVGDVRAVQQGQQGLPSDPALILVEQVAPQLWPLDPVKAGDIFEISWTGVPGTKYYELQVSRTTAFEKESTRASWMRSKL